MKKKEIKYWRGMECLDNIKENYKVFHIDKGKNYWLLFDSKGIP
jgi:hypothetical protein